MSIASKITESAQFIKNAYAAVEARGGVLPSMKNLANLRDAIASIPIWDPANPTLKGLKAAVNAGENIEIGLEIPDIWGGNSNPLIVAQLLDSSNNASYGGAEGLILIRKYIDPSAQAFDLDDSNTNYSTSGIKNFLDTDYLDKCSESLKNVISEINVPYYYNSIISVPSKWFIMSGVECGGSTTAGEGFFWDYWKKVSGLSTPSNAANAGRSALDISGDRPNRWLRTRAGSSSRWLVGYLANTGQIMCSSFSGQGQGPSIGLGVLPACFIGKD